MLSGKFLFTLIGLMLTVLAICNLNLQQNSVEGFWMSGQRKWKAMPVIKTKGCGTVASGGNFLGGLGDDAFVKTPAFQSLMSPRFNATGMTPNIRYNPPPMSMQASEPCNPLLTGGMAQENYDADTQENYPASCGSGGAPYTGNPASQPGFADGDYNNVVNQAIAGSNQPEIVDSLPLGNMTNIMPDGSVAQSAVYQNFIFANQQSRLRQYADKFRGDVPIVPCGGNWFSVHPNLNLDLEPGAMNVMAGAMNETSRATQQLIAAAAGVVPPMAGQANPLAGLNMTPSYSGSYGAQGADVMISGM